MWPGYDGSPSHGKPQPESDTTEVGTCRLPAMPTVRWIRTSEELERFAASLTGKTAIAVDTESDSLHHYREKVCLVQLAPEGAEPVLVDPLALRDLPALARVSADGAIEKVLHGADYDITTLSRDFGFTWASVFDTMISARFLGYTEFGLAALLDRELGVRVSKSRQTDDWSRRPLTPEQESYAAADVNHLIPLRDRLLEKLRAVGREAWVREEFEALARLPPWKPAGDPTDVSRVKGSRDLDPTGLGVLRELLVLRDRIAQEVDRPAFRVMDPVGLIELARLRPKPGVPARISNYVQQLLGRYGEHIYAAVERGVAQPYVPERSDSRPRFLPPSREEAARWDKIRKWRASEAAHLGLDPGVLLPNRLVEVILRESPRDRESLARVPEIRRWRVENFGEAILRALVH